MFIGPYNDVAKLVFCSHIFSSCIKDIKNLFKAIIQSVDKLKLIISLVVTYPLVLVNGAT